LQISIADGFGIINSGKTKTATVCALARSIDRDEQKSVLIFAREDEDAILRTIGPSLRFVLFAAACDDGRSFQVSAAALVRRASTAIARVSRPPSRGTSERSSPDEEGENTPM
jgi:hypothetical protein